MVQHKGESLYAWTDNEVELVLNLGPEYKVNKTQEDAI